MVYPHSPDKRVRQREVKWPAQSRLKWWSGDLSPHCDSGPTMLHQWDLVLVVTSSLLHSMEGELLIKYMLGHVLVLGARGDFPTVPGLQELAT